MAFNISRYRDSDSEEFDIEVVTPMFLGGADTDKAELRIPSIKGVLRFWWRATCSETSLKKMKESEASIFGSTESKSQLILSIKNMDNIKVQTNLKEKGTKFKVHGHSVSIIDYLAYGTYNYKKGSGNVYHKEHITPESKFTLKLIFPKKYRKDILRSFSFFILCGGLGSKGRNGFGSLHTKVEKLVIKNTLKPGAFSAISEESELFYFSPKQTWTLALSEAGMAYREAKEYVEAHHIYNKRKLIAAPITVNKKNEADLERHSKPYFIHVNKLGNGKYQSHILFMPYKYLSGHKNYSDAKHRQYQETCRKMNKILAEKSGGPK